MLDVPIPVISDNYYTLSKFTRELLQKIVDSSVELPRAPQPETVQFKQMKQ